MNVVWYFHVTDSHLAEIMTDNSGHRHHFTLPIGKIPPPRSGRSSVLTLAMSFQVSWQT